MKLIDFSFTREPRWMLIFSIAPLLIAILLYLVRLLTLHSGNWQSAIGNWK